MRILRLIFDKAGPVKGSSLLPIHGYRFIFNMMSDLRTDGRTRPAVRIVKAHAGGEVLKSSWRPRHYLKRGVDRQGDVRDPGHGAPVVSSSNNSVASVPSSVTIAAGSASAAFTIATSTVS